MNTLCGTVHHMSPAAREFYFGDARVVLRSDGVRPKPFRLLEVETATLASCLICKGPEHAPQTCVEFATAAGLMTPEIAAALDALPGIFNRHTNITPP